MVDINNNYSVFTINSNNVYYGNNSTVAGGCKSGYTQVGGDIKYTCSNGSWGKTGTGECKALCNDISSVYDISGNKIADQLYGMGYDSSRSYKVCFKNGNVRFDKKSTRKACTDANNKPQEQYYYNLNKEGTGLGYMNINEYIQCYYNDSFMFDLFNMNKQCEYKYDTVKLTCKNNGNNTYWEANTKSCDLNTIPTSSYITVKLAYNNAAKSISDIMNSGAKQKRLFSGKHPSISIQNPEGSSFDISCNSDGNWNSYVDYSCTGGSQTFTPSKYGIGNGKQLTLEVWGAGADGTSVCGNSKGGYSKGKYSLNNNILYVVVGSKGKKVESSDNTNVGYNGGGKGSHPGNGVQGYSGGGATHIATANGVLSSLESNKNAVLLVAGGAGGSHYTLSDGSRTCNNRSGMGGAGGGGNNNGVDGVCASDATDCSGWGGKTNGSETSGLGHNKIGNCSNVSTNGSFGQGGRAYDINGSENCYATGGGGGGYYGGGGGGRNCSSNYTESGGGGGSGFCGHGVYSCEGTTGGNTAREDGYAKISW